MKQDQTDFQLIYELLNFQPDSVVWFKPIFNQLNADNIPVDFTVGYCNNTAGKILQSSPSDIVGSSLMNSSLMDQESRRNIFQQCKQVWQTGTSVEFNYYSEGLEKHFNVQRTLVHGGILSITRDRTDEAKEEQEKLLQAALLDSVISNSPYGIVLYETIKDESGSIADFKPKLRNLKSAELAGFTEREVVNRTVKELLSKRGNFDFFERAIAVMETGLSIEFEYYSKVLDRWIYFNMVKFGDTLLVHNFDVTQRKLNELKIQEQKEELNSILDASINAVFASEAVRNEEGKIIDLIITKINAAYTELNGSVAEDVENKSFISIYPYAKESGLFDKYCDVINTGKSFRTEMRYKGDGVDGWYDISAVKRGNDSVVVTFTDVTIRKKALIEIEEKRDLLDKILKFSPSGISISEMIRDENGNIADSKTILANEAAARNSGLSLEEQLSKTSREIEPEIINSPLYQLSLKTLRTGKSFHTQYYFEATKRWLELSVAKMDDNHLITVFDDITSTKKAQIDIEKSAEKLHTIINTSQAGFFMGAPVFDEDGTIIDFRCTLANQVFSLFVDKKPEDLIGELGSNWFVQYKNNGLFERFKQAYLSGTKRQFDFHYKGETIDVWANIMITRLGDELLGSFTDFTPVKNLQIQLEKLVEELRRSNANLEEFAYAASHDLQEPLRKIDIFSDKLMRNLSEYLKPEDHKIFQRISSSTIRMKSLINGLLAYSKVNMQAHIFDKVNLNDVLNQVLNDLEATILQTGAVISLPDLPTIIGDDRQLMQLFQNLISNGIKYRRADMIPAITISTKKLNHDEKKQLAIDPQSLKEYYRFEITDNGIGFEKEHASKIFNVFQRLHARSEYDGTGVGLAIVQKVVSNHKGFISATSVPGEGSTFTIILPAS